MSVPGLLDLRIVSLCSYDMNSNRCKFHSFKKSAISNYSFTVPGIMEGAEGLKVTKTACLENLIVSCRKQTGRELSSEKG